MPRTYIKKGRKNNWSTEQLQAAMKAVESKELSKAAASRKYNIPPSMLRDHLVAGAPSDIVDHLQS